MSKIAIMGPIHEDGLQILKNEKFEIIEINDYEKENLIAKIKNVDAIALRTAELTEEILKECKSLKIISRHGVGYDNVDIHYLNSNNIALAITSTANAISVSEHVMGMFLSLCKLSNLSDKLVKTGRFIENRKMPDFFEMYQKNVFIIGFGRIGGALAKRCNGFESKVHVYDPFIDPIVIKDSGYIPINFKEGLRIADFISIHIPLNEKTKYLITKKELNEMKKTCVLVNTARGGIIKEQDLVWALQNKIIYGAGLDVFENEPPKNNNPLFILDNLILSPHNAALTIEGQKRMAIETCNNLVHFLQNRKELNINNIVNKDKINL